MPHDPGRPHMAGNTGALSCNVPACAESIHSRGLCRHHFDRWRTYDLGLPANGDVCIVLVAPCSICGELAVFRSRPRRRPCCRSPKCRKERQNRNNRERERRYFDEHGEYRSRAIERSRPEMKQRAALRNRRRNAEMPVRKRYPDAFAAKDARRRMAMRQGDVAVESIKRVDVFAACAWTCALCHEPVDASMRYPSKFLATLDHIVPIMRGGTHIRVNVQLAHSHCNIAKGDRLEAELSKEEVESWAHRSRNMSPTGSVRSPNESMAAVLCGAAILSA